MKALDLLGRRFGKLLVLSRGENNRHAKAQWLCRCDCGTTKLFLASKLKNGESKSCGCYRTEDAATRFTKHGQWGSPEHRVWLGINQRCHNPKSPAYKAYGAKGIRVCRRWRSKDGFANFLADMGPRPSLEHTLDRYPNQRGGYSPSNCRWATRKEQSANSSRPKLLTFDGKTMNVSDWARHIGISQATLTERLQRGWPIERALGTKKLTYWKRRISQL